MAPTATKPTAAVTAPAKRTAFATFILSILPISPTRGLGRSGAELSVRPGRRPARPSGLRGRRIGAYRGNWVGERHAIGRRRDLGMASQQEPALAFLAVAEL